MVRRAAVNRQLPTLGTKIRVAALRQVVVPTVDCGQELVGQARVLQSAMELMTRFQFEMVGR